MKGIIKIFRWSMKYFYVFLFIILLNILLQWLFSYLPIFVQYAFGVLGYSNKDVSLPKFLIDWYETYGSVLEKILMIGITLVIIQLFRSIMRFLSNYYQGALTQYIGYDMRRKMYSHICDLPFSYHNNVDIGDLIQRTTSDIDEIGNFLSKNLVNFACIFITVGFGAFQVYQISPVLMWVSVATLPITGVSSIVYFRYCNKKFLEIERSESKMTTTIQENISSSRVVRAFGNEIYEFEKMDKYSVDYMNKSRKFSTSMALFWGFNDGLVFIQYSLTLLVGILLSKKGMVDAGDIVAALFLMGMLIWPMRGLGRIIASFGKASVAANRIDEILNKKSEYEINGSLKPEIKGNIEFKNVSFKFDDTNTSLLNNVSFKINKGETIALVGKTGSGKSTICNLLVRYLENNEGSILIDGIDIKDIDKKHLRENVKYVLQDPFLYSKTVYENISITNNDLSKDDVINAAKMASIHNEVLKLQDGYDTLVGEKGTTLSGGQKQRVAIARMLVSTSPIIIFDDSLSALDTKTDLLIRTALKSKDENQTMIIITHRTTTAREADQILVLEDGKIIQAGKHEELVKCDGLYKKLWGIQGDLEAEFNDILGGDDYE